MSQWVTTGQPCPCGKSSDAYATHIDGHGHCFSCNKGFYDTVKPTEEYTTEYLPRRGISKETHEFFGVKTKIDASGKPIEVAYVYPDGAAVLRNVDTKDFRWHNKKPTTGGWGTQFFPAGSAKAITITEGREDAMSVYELLGKYPVYSINSASSAVRDVRTDYEYLNSFEKIYLALDNDAPGAKAAEEIAGIFGYGKIYHVRLAPYKDANDFLVAGRAQEFKNCWYNAQRFMPEGIVSSFAQISNVLSEASKHPRWETPYKKLNWMLGGGLQVHKTYLLSGLTGIGKTEFFRGLQHKWYNDHEKPLGILHFEEPLDETIERAVGCAIRSPIHLDDYKIPSERVLEEWKKLVKKEDRVHFVKHFGSEDPDTILAKIRFLVAACGCEGIFFDNITVTSTGRKQEDSVAALDYFSTQLEMLVKELPFWLFFISHENEQEGTRGSQNINKVADVWLNMKRDVKTENDTLRNIQHLTLFKNRQAGRTGPAGKLIYDPNTAVLSEFTDELPT